MTITAEDTQNSIDRATALGIVTLGDAIEYALARGQWPSELFGALAGTDAELEAFTNLPITNEPPAGWPVKD